MRRFLLILIALILLAPRSLGEVGANHKCGEACDQWTEQGACTHGCGDNGQTNPDYRNPDDYKYNGPPQEEIDRLNAEAALAAENKARAEAAGAAAAAAEAERVRAEAVSQAAQLEAQKLKAEQIKATDQAAEAAKQPITTNIEGKCDGWANPGSEHRNSGNGCFYTCDAGSWKGPNRCDGQGNGLFQGEPGNLSPEEIAKAVSQRQSEAYLTVLKQDGQMLVKDENGEDKIVADPNVDPNRKTTAQIAAETASQRTAEQGVQAQIAIKEYETKVAAANRETNVDLRNQMLAEFALLYQNSVPTAGADLSHLDATVVSTAKAKLEKDVGGTTSTEASSVAQTALKDAKCDINFGLCQAIDPKTGAVTGWVPADKPVFCDSSCALAARMKVIIGSSYQTITIDGKQYQAFDWNGDIQESSLKSVDVTAIKKVADANKVKVDASNNAIINLSKDQIADLQKRVDNFSKEQESVQKALAADINKKIPDLLAECNCSADKFAEFVKEKSNDLHLNLLTTDNATLILSSVKSYAIDNGLISSYSSLNSNSVIQACYNLLKNNADKTDCDNLDLARQTLRDAISSDNRTLADDQLRANQKASDLAISYQNGGNVTIDQLKVAGLDAKQIAELTTVRQQNIEIARLNLINIAALNLYNSQNLYESQGALSDLDAATKLEVQKRTQLLQQYLDCRNDNCTNLFSQLQSIFDRDTLININENRLKQIKTENIQIQTIRDASTNYATGNNSLPPNIQSAIDTKYTQLENNLIMTRLAASIDPANTTVKLSDSEKEYLRQQAFVDVLSQHPESVTLNPSTDQTEFQNYINNWKAPAVYVRAPTIDQLKQDAVKFAVQTCATSNNLSTCTQSRTLDHWGAAQRVFEGDPTLTNLPTGNQLYQDFLAQKVNPIELEQNLINIRSDWKNVVALKVNNIFNGTTATGTLLQKEAKESGLDSYENIYKYMRGTWIAGAPIAAAGVAIAGIGLLPIVAPTVAAVTGTGLLGGVLTTVGTGFGIYGTTQGIGSTYQACPDGAFAGTSEQKYACTTTGLNTIYMALSTGMGVATGAYASASKAATTLNLSKIGNSGSTLVADVNLALKSGTIAVNIPAWVERVGFVNSIIGMGVFGSQAVVECGKGLSVSCVINFGMAIGSAGHFSTSIASRVIPTSNIDAAIALGRTNRVSGEISELADKLDGLNSCKPTNFNIGDCISGLIDGFADGNSVSVKNNMLQAPTGLVSAQQHMNELATKWQTSSTDALDVGDRITMTKAVMDAIDENRYIQTALETKIPDNPTAMQWFLSAYQTAYEIDPNNPANTYNLLHALYLVQQERVLLTPVRTLFPSRDLNALRQAQQELDQIAHNLNSDITTEYLPQANKVLGLLIAAQKEKFTPEQTQRVETALANLTNNLSQQAAAHTEAAKQTGDPSFSDAAQKAEQATSALTQPSSPTPPNFLARLRGVGIPSSKLDVGDGNLVAISQAVRAEGKEVVGVRILDNQGINLLPNQDLTFEFTKADSDLVSRFSSAGGTRVEFTYIDGTTRVFGTPKAGQTFGFQEVAPKTNPLQVASNYFQNLFPQDQVTRTIAEKQSQLNQVKHQIGVIYADASVRGLLNAEGKIVSQAGTKEFGVTYGKKLNDHVASLTVLQTKLENEIASLKQYKVPVSVSKLDIGNGTLGDVVGAVKAEDRVITSIRILDNKGKNLLPDNNIAEITNDLFFRFNQARGTRVEFKYADGTSRIFVSPNPGQAYGLTEQKPGLIASIKAYLINLIPKNQVVDFVKETAQQVSNEISDIPCRLSSFSIISSVKAAGSGIPCGKISINTSGRQTTNIDGVGKVYILKDSLQITSGGEGIYRTAKVGETVQIINSSGETANIKVVSITGNQIVVKIDNKPNKPLVSRPHLAGDEPKISPIRDPNKSGPTYEYNGYQAYDLYVENYGQQPAILYTGAKHTDLFPFQEDLIEAAKGQAIDLNKVISFLNKNKIGVNIYSNPAELMYAEKLSDEINKKSDIPRLVREASSQGKLPKVNIEDIGAAGFSSNTRRGLLETLAGKNKQEIYLLTPDLYAKSYQTTPKEGLIIFYQKLGHEGGHSMDDTTFGNLSSWATELRQKQFNVRLYQAIGDVQLAREYQIFVDETLKSSKQVLYNKNEKVNKIKYQSSLPILLAPIGGLISNPVLAPLGLLTAPYILRDAIAPLIPSPAFQQFANRLAAAADNIYNPLNWSKAWEDVNKTVDNVPCALGYDQTQQKTVLADGLVGKGDTISPLPDKYRYGTTSQSILSIPNSNMRRAGDLHSNPPFGGSNYLSGSVPSSGIYPPHTLSISNIFDWFVPSVSAAGPRAPCGTFNISDPKLLDVGTFEKRNDGLYFAGTKISPAGVLVTAATGDQVKISLSGPNKISVDNQPDHNWLKWKWQWPGQKALSPQVSQIISDVHAQVQRELAPFKSNQEIIDYIKRDMESMGVEIRDGTPRVATKGYDVMKNVNSMSEIYVQIDMKRPALAAHEWEHARQVKAFLDMGIPTGLVENKLYINQVEAAAYATGTKIATNSKSFDAVAAFTQPIALAVAKVGLISPLNTFSRVVTYPINAIGNRFTRQPPANQPPTTTIATNLNSISSEAQQLTETFKPDSCSKCSVEFSKVIELLQNAKTAQTAEERLNLLDEAYTLMLDHLLDNQPAYASASILAESELFALFGVNKDELINSLEEGLSIVRKAKMELPNDDSPFSSSTRLSRLETGIGQLITRLNPTLVDIFEDKTPEAMDFKRFIYYITGIWLEPGSEYKLAQRMQDDALVVRQKYHLPSRQLKIDQPAEYINQLKAIAQKEGVPIRSGIEFQRFFKKHSAAAVYFGDTKTIVIPLGDVNEYKQIFKFASNLEHELIHALQDKYYPGMPIEAMEYEAYAVNRSPTYLKDKPIDAIEISFSFFIRGSVNHWYKDQEIISKPWDDLKPPPPQSPVSKVVEAVKETVNNTPCALGYDWFVPSAHAAGPKAPCGTFNISDPKLSDVGTFEKRNDGLYFENTKITKEGILVTAASGDSVKLYQSSPDSIRVDNQPDRNWLKFNWQWPGKSQQNTPSIENQIKLAKEIEFDINGKPKLSNQGEQLLANTISDWIDDKSNLINTAKGKQHYSLAREYISAAKSVIPVLNKAVGPDIPPADQVNTARSYQNLAIMTQNILEGLFSRDHILITPEFFQATPQKITEDLFTAPIIYDSSGQRVSIENYLLDRYSELISQGVNISFSSLTPREIVEQQLRNDYYANSSYFAEDRKQQQARLLRLDINSTESILTMTITSLSGKWYPIPITYAQDLAEQHAYGYFGFNFTPDGALEYGRIAINPYSVISAQGRTQIIEGLPTILHEIDHAIYHSITSMELGDLNNKKQALFQKKSNMIETASKIAATNESIHSVSELEALENKLPEVSASIASYEKILKSNPNSETEKARDEAIDFYTKLNQTISELEITLVEQVYGIDSPQVDLFKQTLQDYGTISDELSTQWVYQEHLGEIIAEGLARRTQLAFLDIQKTYMPTGSLSRGDIDLLFKFLKLHTIYARDANSTLTKYGLGQLLITYPNNDTYIANSKFYVENAAIKAVQQKPDLLLAAIGYYAIHNEAVSQLFGINTTYSQEIKGILRNQNVTFVKQAGLISEWEHLDNEFVTASSQRRQEIISNLEQEVASLTTSGTLATIKDNSSTERDYMKLLGSYKYFIIPMKMQVDDIAQFKYDYAQEYDWLANFVRNFP